MTDSTPAHGDADSLDGVMSLADYQQARARFFPSLTSVQWYCRVHREELKRRGALLRIAGRLYVDQRRLDQAVRETGA
jgi:hypothetical protein